MQSQTTIPDEHLEFIERYLFYEFDAAYSKFNNGHPNRDEVIAYERALETMTEIRTLLTDRPETTIEPTTSDETVLDQIDALDTN